MLCVSNSLIHRSSPITLLNTNTSKNRKEHDMTQTTAITTSNTITGRREVDPAHSAVEFRVRHAGVARVRGTFDVFEGELVVDPGGTITARGAVDAASLTTRLGVRDDHLRSSDFLDVERHPRIGFTSTSVETGADGAIIMLGELTIRGVSREIELTGEILGRGRDDDGAERLGLALEGRLDRRDYGLTWNAAVEGGGMLVGNRVDIALEISAVR